MWIFKNDAVLSIVAHLDEPGKLLVRSRVPGDIERALPGADVYEDPSADYRYRADVPRETVAAALAEALATIGYGNFKASVADPRRHRAYSDVWAVLAREYGAFGSGDGK